MNPALKITCSAPNLVRLSTTGRLRVFKLTVFAVLIVTLSAALLLRRGMPVSVRVNGLSRSEAEAAYAAERDVLRRIHRIAMTQDLHSRDFAALWWRFRTGPPHIEAVVARPDGSLLATVRVGRQSNTTDLTIRMATNSVATAGDFKPQRRDER